MQLNDDQITWLNKLGKTARRQVEKDKTDAQKTLLLDKYAEQREKNFDTILEGVKITVGKEGDKGKVETQDVWRKDLDPTKSFDLDEQRQGYRVTDKSGKKIEGKETKEWKEGQELVEQPEFQKLQKAERLLLQMTDDLHNTKVDGIKKGKPVKKPLFSKDELMDEVYTPLVRRGVPETFIGNDYSRTQKMVDGSFDAYKKRLEKEDLKGFVAENKDLGMAMFRMCIALPGNIMASKGATDLLASQQQTITPDPVHVFQQNFGVISNDPKVAGEAGEFADNVQKAAQTWAFIQNVSDIAIDGFAETINAVGELSESGEEDGKEGGKEGKKKVDHTKLAPVITQSMVTSMSLNVGKALEKLGNAGSTIFGGKVNRAEINKLLSKKDVKGADITGVIQQLCLGIDKTLDVLKPDNPTQTDTQALTDALDQAKAAFTKLKPDEIAKFLLDGKVEKVVSAFNGAATTAGDSMKNELAGFVQTNKEDMKKKAGDFVADSLKDDLEDSKRPEENEKHKEEKKHDPDWVEWKGKMVCLRCTSDSKDLDLFAGVLEQKIVQLKKDELYFKMAVNLGGLAFDVAANFLAPLAMGGALLRMSRFIFAAVKRTIDFSNFCDAKTAMINSASAYSPAVRQFRANSGKQALHYSINAACEGTKIVGACLQCSPAVIGGIIAAQVASGIEAVEAVLYEIAKRQQLSEAWKTYKKALNNPENRKLALIAMRKNPTLAKYAMAWGAVIEEDPLVGDFMSYTGITADTIRGTPEVDKVVEYLEARMPDDITVVGRRYDVDVDWAPAKVKLTVDSWLDAKTRGETQGGVAPADTSKVEAALANYETACEVLESVKDGKRVQREAKTNAALKALAVLRGAIRTYNPKDAKTRDRSEDMWEVVQLFISQTGIDQVGLEKKLKEVTGVAKRNPGQKKQLKKKVATVI